MQIVAFAVSGEPVKTVFRILLVITGVAGLILTANAQNTKNQVSSIIDMHLHAQHAEHVRNTAAIRVHQRRLAFLDGIRNSFDQVTKWRPAAPDRVIPAIPFAEPKYETHDPEASRHLMAENGVHAWHTGRPMIR
jgi:hypothetical protein